MESTNRELFKVSVLSAPGPCQVSADIAGFSRVILVVAVRILNKTYHSLVFRLVSYDLYGEYPRSGKVRSTLALRSCDAEIEHFTRADRA